MFRLYTTTASVWIWQLNILCYSAGKWTIWKQSSRLGDISRFVFTLACTRSVWLLEGISTVKILSSDNQVGPWLILLWVTAYVSSNACMHSIVSVCLLLSGTELNGIETLWAANHSWQFSQLKNVKFQSLSRDLPSTLTCPWLSFLAAN